MTKVSPISTIRVGGYKMQEKLEDTYTQKETIVGGKEGIGGKVVAKGLHY